MESAMGLGIVLSLKDLASEGIEKVRQNLASFSGASEEMFRKFDSGVKEMLGGFASMAAGTKIFSAFQGAFGSSVNTAADFEQAMARVGAVSGAVGEDFEALTQQAKELGAKTQFSASQAAASQESLARAGFKTNEIISAMPRLLNMAAAEGMDLANAADIAASAIAGFGMDASEAGRVADVLAKTSAASNTSIALLGESLKYVAPYAKAVGVDIEQTNAMLGIMANAGIKGSIAGNALKSAFSRLSEEPTRVAKALKSVGVEAKTSTGELRPFPELMKDLSQKMEGMGRADKVGLFNKIFGSAAGGGMLAVMDGVANGNLPELEAALYGASGAAQAMAERMNATAQGAMKRLESASEGLSIAIGNHLLPAYTWIIDTMANFKGWLTQQIEAHPILTKAVIALTGALTALAGTIMIVTGAMSALSGFIKVWPVMKATALTALKTMRANALSSAAALKGMALPVLGLVALAGTLYAAWRTNFAGIRDMVRAVTEGFKMAFSAGKDGVAEVDEALYDELQKAGIWDFAVIMGKVFYRIRQLWEGFTEGFMEGVKQIKGFFKYIVSAFEPVVSGGKSLLKLLGMFKPIADTQSSKWRQWGKAIGNIVPYILAVIAAFKGMSIATTIIGNISKAFGLITAHPIVAAIVAVIAAIAYLYTHWDEFAEWFNNILGGLADVFGGVFEHIQGVCNAVIGILTLDWEKFVDGIKGIFAGIIDTVKGVWNTIKTIFAPLVDWWNSLELGNIFAPVAAWASGVKDRAVQLWQDFMDWWDSWTIGDIFASLFGFAVRAKDKVMNTIKAFREWWDNLALADIFAPLFGFASLAKDKAVQALGAVRDWWNSWTLSDVFASVRNYASDAKEYVVQKLDSLKAWWDSWTFADVFAPVKEYAGNAKDYAMQKLTYLQTWWNSWTLSDVFAPLKGYAGSAIESLKTVFPSFANWAENYFKLDFSSMFEGLNSSVQSVKDTFSNLGSTIKSLLTFDFSGAWDSLIASTESIKGIFKGIGEAFMSLFNIDASKVISGIKSVFYGVEEVLAGIGKTIMGIFSFDFSGIKEGLLRELSGLKEIFAGIGKYIAGVFNVDLSAVRETITGCFGSAISWVKDKWQGLTDSLALISEGISSKISAVIGNVKESFSSGVSWIKDLWEGFVEGLINVFTGLPAKIKGVIDSVIGFMQPLFDGFRWIGEKLGIVEADPHAMDSLAPAPAAGEQNYKEYRSSLEGRGYVLNDDDTVKKLPADLMMSDMMAQQAAQSAVEEQLKKLRDEAAAKMVQEDRAKMLAGMTLQPPAPITQTVEGKLIPTWSKDADELSKKFGVDVNVPEINPNNIPAQYRDIFTPKQNPIMPYQQPIVQPQSYAPASGYLIQQAQNQAAMAAQATTAQAQNAQASPVDVHNQVDVKIESKPVEIYLDGEKVGSAAMKWIERQNIRSGMGAL